MENAMKRFIYSVTFLLLVFAATSTAQAVKGITGAATDSAPAREPIKPASILRTTTMPVAVKNVEPQQTTKEKASAAIPMNPYNRLVWGDFDGDTLQDLLVLDLSGNHLLKNLGDGGFEDVTDLAFHEGADRGISGSWGDFNNDGFLDLFLFHMEGFTLYRNDGRSRFTDVTETMNLDPGLSGYSAKMDDYDQDGLPDLIVKTPRGDRIFKNRNGRGFDKVELPGVEVEDNIVTNESSKQGVRFPINTLSGTPNLMDVTPNDSGSPPNKETYPTEQENDGSSEGIQDFNTLFVNDNSPNSVGLGVPEVEGGDDDTKQNDIVDHTIAGSDLEVPFELAGTSGPYPEDAVFNVVNAAPDAGSIGMRGESTAADGTGVTGVGFNGVHGEATGTSGENAGVLGETSSTGGYGVRGEGPIYGVSGLATAASSWNWGVRGETGGTKGHGVGGYATSATGNTFGVLGRSYSEEGKGVYGYASASSGSNIGVYGQTNSDNGLGVKGEAKSTTGHAYGVHGITNANNGRGVFGESLATSGSTYGVYGVNNGTSAGAGVAGRSPYMALYGYCTGASGYGVYASCNSSGGTGVKGTGAEYGLWGTTNEEQGYGIFGEAERYGIRGNATGSTGYSYGVRGDSSSTGAWAVYGSATATTGVTRGVYGYSASIYGTGVYGWAAATSGDTFGVFGKSDSPDGCGVYGVCTATGGHGGYFIGGTSTDSLQIRGGSDLSEQFDINCSFDDMEPEPGMVVCIDAEHPGELTLSTQAYDRTVAGIISGAGGIETGMLMGQEGSVAHGDSPVALTGRVYCYVDASRGAVQPGDLLTTSDIPGHAMKVLDYEKAQGAIIGKAMTPLKTGRGLVLVLVSLQ